MARKAKIDGSEARRLFESGAADVDALAQKYEVTRSAVYQALKKEGVEFRSRKRFNPSNELGAQIVKGYTDENLSAKEIGDTVGVSGNTILAFLRNYGVDVRSRGRPRTSGEDTVQDKPIIVISTEDAMENAILGS